jgi:hypothetical protein
VARARACARLCALQTDLPEFKWKQFSVIRRFRDFDALHTRLGDAHPGARAGTLALSASRNPTHARTHQLTAARAHAGCVIPALPEKRFATKLVTLGPDFALQRCALLDMFLKRCAAHAVLRRSPHLAAFLQADDSAWGAAAAAALPRSEMTLAKQRDAGGPLGSGALKELTRTAAAILVGRPDAADAEYDRLRCVPRGAAGACTQQAECSMCAACAHVFAHFRRLPRVCCACAQLRTYYTELEAHLTECQQQVEKLIRRQISACSLCPCGLIVVGVLSLSSCTHR